MNRSTGVLVLLVASACAGSRGQATPLAPRIDAALSSGSATTQSADTRAAAPPAPSGGWLTEIGDDNLDALIAEALAHSFAIDELEASLGRARALVRRADAAFAPRIDAVAVASGEGSAAGGANGLVRVGIAASWEPDLFSRLRHARSAADSSREARVADVELARRALAGAVAEAYFVAVAATRLANVTRQNDELLRETLGYVETQHARGLRSGQDIALIRADVSASSASVAAAERAVRDAKRALEVLCGRLPTGTVAVVSEPASVPTHAAAQVSAALLERRPDLVAAARRVDAARSSRAAAGADELFIPRVGLSGSIGFEGDSADSVADSASAVWRLGVDVTVPLFDGGARASVTGEAAAALDEQLARYNAAALAAFQEVEDAIDLGRDLVRREAALTAALGEARKALKFARFRYQSGDSDLLDVLSIQQRVATVESQLTVVQRQRLVHYVALGLALGGGID